MPTTARSGGKMVTSIYDVCPYIGDYVHEVVDLNGNDLTWETVRDILGDFAEKPEGMTDATFATELDRLAREYVGD